VSESLITNGPVALWASAAADPVPSTATMTISESHEAAVDEVRAFILKGVSSRIRRHTSVEYS